jgi:hypothetical protein
MSDTSESYKNEDEFSIFNLNSVIVFVKKNIIQILLFGLVFFIIYIVDRVTHLNNIITAAQQQQMMKEHMKQMKKGKKNNKQK